MVCSYIWGFLFVCFVVVLFCLVGCVFWGLFVCLFVCFGFFCFVFFWLFVCLIFADLTPRQLGKMIISRVFALAILCAVTPR